ncbi:Oxoglutarate/iron-dependent dioxygenase [Corchorus olitorius]|uniref:Oxoglutarate/iron-dependent dioxygenase n=1 Tax=Corchorus olitorius TaxID=93759 RepID=A0A1R3JQW1_9ROSI|nr:Oxoglutarate/iron-dependent dioxygenase [Corchorus olitorius]
MSSNETFSEIEEAPTYEPSIPVPNVQELVRKDPLQVPQRYVRDMEDRPNDTDMSHLSSLIPIIDMSLLLMGNEDELNKLDLACQEWGFFQLVNHGVPNEVLQKMKDSAAEFFDLPLEEKNKYAMPSNDVQGYGHAYVVSEEQILDWSDALILVVHPSHYRKLDFWPKSPKGLKEIIEEYSNAIQKVGIELLQLLSHIMGMEKEALLKLHKQLVQAYRVNYYPPCSKPDQVIGVSPHSDSGTIAILMQEDYISGLQIQHKGEWVPVDPIPNALVVNVGDVIEMWSNGKYKSIIHRAVTNTEKARISYASFLYPHDEAEIEPLDRMLSPQSPQRMYKRVKFGEYLRNSLKMKMEGKAHTKMARIDTIA